MSLNFPYRFSLFKKTKSWFLFLFLMAIVQTGYSQCTYTLELFDSFGDGWNGSELSVNISGSTTGYTIDTGDEAIFTFEGISNELVTISYSSGGFEGEVTYNILGLNGEVIFSDGPFPQTGEVFSFFACPTCPAPTAITIDNLGAEDIDISWNASDSSGVYTIEYGPTGFMPGDGMSISTSGSSVSIFGLMENTSYDFYISLSCDNGDTSAFIGPIPFQTIWLDDIGIVDIQGPDPICNLGMETITVTLQNFGDAPQSLIPFRYSVNGIDAGVTQPLDGLYTGILSNDSLITLTFETTYDFSEYGTYEILAWTELDEDAAIQNDTASFSFVNIAPDVLPLAVDFEDAILPENWASTSTLIAEDHNTGSVAIYANIYSFNPLFELTTSLIGPINPGDSLTYDYRYTDWSAGIDPTVLSAGDQLEVQISLDCGATFTTIQTIDMSNHTPSATMTNQLADLDPYAGELITLRFRATWGAGDYWFDLDNINIIGCPIDLNLSAEITDETNPGENDGSASISLEGGEGPYEFIWSNGDTTMMSSDLPGGTYTVTVVDANGCSDLISFDVGGIVGIEELNDNFAKVLLAPNPTSTNSALSLELNQAADINIRVSDITGRIIFETLDRNIIAKSYNLDLSDQAAGLYFISISAGTQSEVLKLIKTQ